MKAQDREGKLRHNYQEDGAVNTETDTGRTPLVVHVPTCPLCYGAVLAYTDRSMAWDVSAYAFIAEDPTEFTCSRCGELLDDGDVLWPH